MAHRKQKETKQQPSLLPGPAVPGCSLVSFHFLWAILCPQAVQHQPTLQGNFPKDIQHNITNVWMSNSVGLSPSKHGNDGIPG